MRSMGIDQAEKPARDAQVVKVSVGLFERAAWSRRARGPMRSMGIEPAEVCARDCCVVGPRRC